MIIEENYKNIPTEKWLSFLDKNKNANVFHNPLMLEVYEKTALYEPIGVFLLDSNGDISGLLTGAIQKESKGFWGYFSSRCVILGGPLVKDNDPILVDRLLKKLNQIVRYKAIYTQFRNLFDIEAFQGVFEQNNYTFEPHLDILIDLNKPFDVLKGTIHKSRLKNLRKSYNKGSVCKIIEDIVEIEKGYELIRQTYRRIKLPFPDKDLFDNIVRILVPQNLAKCYALYFEDELIGFRVVLTFKQMIYDYYAGNHPNHTNKYPNDFLILEVLKDGCEQEYEVFDFGGAGKPNIPYGVRDHKMQFGGQLVEYGRFLKVHNKPAYQLGKLGISILKKIKL